MKSNGFTMTELMLVLLLISSVAVILAPSFRDASLSIKISAQVNQTIAMLNSARIKALEQPFIVVYCPVLKSGICSSDWRLQKKVFVDENNNKILDSSEQIIATQAVASSGISVIATSKAIVFHASGLSATPASIVFCSENNEARFNRGVFVSLQGKARLSTKDENSGLHVTGSGKDLSCQS